MIGAVASDNNDNFSAAVVDVAVADAVDGQRRATKKLLPIKILMMMMMIPSTMINDSVEGLPDYGVNTSYACYQAS